MPDILSQLLTLATLVFSIAIFVLVWFQRRVVELVFPKVLTKKYWRELVVPAWPVVTGGFIAALISSYPYPDVFKNTWSARCAFGIFCGLFSGLVYRLTKKNLLEKLGVATPDASTTTPPTDGTDQIQ
jgi:hypothetical protein